MIKKLIPLLIIGILLIAARGQMVSASEMGGGGINYLKNIKKSMTEIAIPLAYERSNLEASAISNTNAGTMNSYIMSQDQTNQPGTDGEGQEIYIDPEESEDGNGGPGDDNDGSEYDPTGDDLVYVHDDGFVPFEPDITPGGTTSIGGEEDPSGDTTTDDNTANDQDVGL
jgi:hypothetical protein